MAFTDLHSQSAQATRAPHAGGVLPGYGFGEMTRDMQRADEKFWAAHAAWRAAEAAFEADDGDDNSESYRTLFEAMDFTRDAMFSAGVFSASALSAKLVAIDEGARGSCMDMDLPGGYTVFDAIQWDCERVAKREYLPELGATGASPATAAIVT